MASTSPSERALELLNLCIAGAPCPESLIHSLASDALHPDERIAKPATQALFTTLIERLADLFEPSLCGAYASLFSRVLEIAFPGEMRAAELVERYRTVSAVRSVNSEPRRVVVLSRVTLGADIAITSMVLDAAKQRFPNAKITFAAPPKAWELFEKDPRLEFLPVNYGRTGLLRDRLACFHDLQRQISRPHTIVLDPDSRLTQLGLLPVCPPENHFLFESRSYGADSGESLSALTADWIRQTLGVVEAVPYLYPKFEYDFGSQRVLTVSLGVGANPAKRLGDEFEREMLRHFSTLPAQVFIDKGAPGSDEARRVESHLRSLGQAGAHIGVHEGSFASFAAMIAASSAYFGYDSAGQHVAAALGVPLVSVFCGFASDRMLARWTPDGPGPITVLRADGFDSPARVLDHAKAAVSRYTEAI